MAFTPPIKIISVNARTLPVNDMRTDERQKNVVNPGSSAVWQIKLL